MEMGNSSDLPDFWHRRLPVWSQHEPAVKYSLIALGAAHKPFLSQACLDYQSNPGHHFIHNYNAAIRHIRAIMEIPTPEHIAITLACCILFVALENMRGNYLESARHLKAGYRLLCSLLEPAKERVDPVSPDPVCQPSNLDHRMDDIVGLFTRHGLDLDYSFGTAALSQRGLYGNVLTSDLSSMGPFSSIYAARSELYNIEIVLNILGDIFSPENEAGDKGCSGVELEREDPLQYTLLQKRFQKWSVYMDLLASNLLQQPSSRREQYDLRLLIYHQTLFKVMLADDWYGQKFGFPDESILALVKQAEILSELREPVSHPVFVPNADLVMPLQYCGSFTKNVSLLKRIVRLLRRLNIREGCCDSVATAEAFEARLDQELCAASNAF